MPQSRRVKQRPTRTVTWRTLTARVGGLAVAALLLVGGWYFFRQQAGGAATDHEHGLVARTVEHLHGQDVALPHIHGMGYLDNGERLIVAAHDGLRVFVDAEWLIPDLPVNDYMGFSPVDDGFYSSGHPGPDSALPNPLGLVRSIDDGLTLTALGFDRESDFHLMGVGYRTHAIYVLNPAANSRLDQGLHYSLNDGETWQQSRLDGLRAQPLALAVHPTEANVVALGTETGLLLSTDYGNQFALIGAPDPVTAVAFTPAGEQLLFGYRNVQTYDLASDEVEVLSIPDLGTQDAIAYIVANTAAPGEIAVASQERDIYLSHDGGRSWQAIARAGKGV